jgi:hypothetical protein
LAKPAPAKTTASRIWMIQSTTFTGVPPGGRLAAKR